MYRTLIFLFLLSSIASATPRFSVGPGIEARLQKEVNPDYVEGALVSRAFAQMQFDNWGGQLEGGFENKSSESGGLKITSRTLSLGLWGRYVLGTESRWRPFFSAGFGSYFDHVTSEFNGAHDERDGRRYFLGAGAGVRALYWDHLLLEAELRILGVRERKEPLGAALFSIGYTF